MTNLFSDDKVNLESLKRKAYNYRWATLEEDVIPLTAADPDFRVSKKITEAISKYASDGYFSYCPPEGLPEFKNAIAAWYKRQYNVNCKAENILPVNSTAYGLFIAAKSILKPGDNAIIPNPVDFLFRKSIEHAGAEVRPISVNNTNAEFDLTQLESTIDANTKAIFICNPNNPLGKVPSCKHLEALTKLAIKHNLWLVSDEIWADITYNNQVTSLGCNNLPSFNKRLILAGLSKNFGLAGLRIGYVICSNKATFDHILKISNHSSTAFGISGVSQASGTSALTECDDWQHQFIEHLSKMRQLTLNFIDDMPFLESVSPNATYLAFPKLVNTQMTSQEVVEFLHKKARVALVPGGKDWFESESEGHIRICYATSEGILTSAFNRIRELAHLIT